MQNICLGYMRKKMEDENERIIVVPEETVKKIKEAGIEKEFNEILDRLEKGEILGSAMEIEDCEIYLKCAQCGSKNIKWMLDKAHNEVIFNCKDCNNSGWMYKEDYEDAIKRHPDCIIKR